MTLRTPRRHISPRTKRRCRAIKDFLRRAIGTTSQPDTKTSSTIEISVSDLKRKIIGIEQQLNNVSKHCQDLSGLEHSFTRESENSLALLQQGDTATGNTENSDTNINDVETKLLYKSTKSQHHTSKNNTVSEDEYDDTNDMASANQSAPQKIPDFQYRHNNREIRDKRRERNDFDLVDQRATHSKYESIRPVYSTSSFHSLVESGIKHCSKPRYTSHRHEKRHPKKEYTEPFISKEHRNRETLKNVLGTREREHYDKHKTKRTKRVYSDVDKDFIADIIKRQYRPVKLFGRRDSGFSQFSAPICRDQEFTVRDRIQEGIELCSCCFDKSNAKRHRYVRHSDLSDMRSICDTRLYSSKKNRRYKLERDNVDDYNNSALYDVVPVKEKSSPKARRKFTEDNMIAHQWCKEVPPSPRSNRPRLNLKVQHYADYDDDSLYFGRQRIRRSSPSRDVRKKVLNVIESDVSFDSNLQRTQPEILNCAKSRNPVLIQEDVGTMSSLQYTQYANEHVNIPKNNTTLNTQQSDSAADKTDKTLCEIKDILRTFLVEMKKESSYSDKSDGTSKIKHNPQQPQENQTNSNLAPNSGDIFNNYNARQCGAQPFLPTFPSPYCYPILPVCPMNCMQNGYVIPSPSFTCNLCAKASKDHGCPDKDSPYNKCKPPEEVNTYNETQELIKEIYKFVSQNPKSARTRDDYSNECNSARSKKEGLFDKKFLTSRYVGRSSKGSKHDANVGTPHLKSHSKSCEAVGSRMASETYNTNASYSDTILEKLSLEPTQSSTESVLSADVPNEKVLPRLKLRKVFNPLRLFKKKKKDAILEESESAVEVESQRKPPFQQHIQSYAMHGQEYYHPPSPLAQHCCHSPHHECIGHGYDPRNSYPHAAPPPEFYNNHKYRQECTPTPRYNPKYPTAPTYSNCDPLYHQIPPQVPLCLKEIEVKSIGTQSDRKVSMLRKIAKKIPAQQQQEASRPATVKEKTNFWKTMQEKANQNRDDTMNFSLKTQKDLTQGDMNLKNVMMKKLFYKKNPFSPRNLIMRTILGKDQSSYGNPPKMYRPKIFL